VKRRMFTTILSDMAPSTSGSKPRDAHLSYELAEAAVRLALGRAVHAASPCSDMLRSSRLVNLDPVVCGHQGLTLVHLSAQPKPFGHTSECPRV
jgi:hypothetical protein